MKVLGTKEGTDPLFICPGIGMSPVFCALATPLVLDCQRHGK